jgi:hypothetical protein
LEPLEIPLHLNSAQALAELRKLGQVGTEAGKDVEKGAKGAQDSHEGLAGAMRRVNIEMAAISMGKQALDALAAGAVQASQDLAKMAQEFIVLRDRGRELAGVLNVKGDTAFTIEQAKFGAETGFADPGKAVDYRTAFQGEANQYAGKFTSPEEFSQFEKEAAKLGNQNNVPADVMAKLAGMVVRTGGEGQTSADAMKRLGGSFKTMMAGSGAIGELAGQLSRMSGLVGEGKAFGTIEEAATSTRMSAETNLPEAYTQATEMRQGVLELSLDEKSKDKAKELGIDENTGNLDAIKKLSEGQKSSGKSMDAYLMTLFPMKRVRDSFRDAITAYRNNVMTQGLKDAASVQKGETEAGTAAFFADPTQGGKLSMEKGKTALAEAEYSQERALIEPALEQARGETVAQRASPLAKALTGLGNLPGFNLLKGGMSGTEGLEYWKAYQNTQKQAEEAGVDMSKVVQPGALAGERTIQHAMAQLILLTKEANEHRQKATAKPLTAPPPKPAERS